MKIKISKDSDPFKVSHLDTRYHKIIYKKCLFACKPRHY